MKKLLLIGGGGHCKSVIDSLLENCEYDDMGIVDFEENIGKDILGIKIIGTDDCLENLYKIGYEYAFVTLGSIGNPKIRIKLYNILKQIGFKIPIIIDKTAVISKNCSIKEGAYIGKNVVINAGSIVEKCSIINTGSIIEHDCKIEEFVHIASGSVLGGGVTIKKNSHIGSNSTIRQQIVINENAIIGIGSVVVKNIENNVLAYGIPCRMVKKI